MKRPATGGYAPRGMQQPDGAVRQSQMVTTFGPGSMVDLLHDAVLVGGLDFWSYEGGAATPYIDEPRLRDAIVAQFKQLGRELSQDRPFRAPPVGNDREPTKASGVAVLEFPQWYVCQNPRCRSLQRNNGLDRKGGQYVHACTQTERGAFVPVRFVEACKRGHLSDFRWIAFVHQLQGRDACASPTLTFDEGASGDFQDIRVACTCGASARLNQAMSGVRMGCHGARPWLGPQGREECSEDVRLLVRTASNSYFSQSVSALSIPDPSGELQARVRGEWATLKNVTIEALPTLRAVIEGVRIALEGYSDAQVMAAVASLREEKPAGAKPIRTAEFEQFTAAKPEARGDLPPVGANFFARRVEPKGGLPRGVARVVVVPKLREVIAQVGFTRLEPVTPDVQGEYDLGVTTATLGLTATWLPASEVRGEGVFVQLDEAAVRAWEVRPAVQERTRQLSEGYAAWSRGAEKAPPFPGARFYLLHSLSHLLIAAISLECGYAASALRERIYAGPTKQYPEPAMAAVLLSTGTTGTEGTLGGLVEQGRALRAHLRRAWDLGRLCSNDPVCAAHSPEGDHAERYLEGAACHGCLFVAECSCERFNRYLDRALVVPSLGHPDELAFFSERP